MAKKKNIFDLRVTLEKDYNNKPGEPAKKQIEDTIADLGKNFIEFHPIVKMERKQPMEDGSSNWLALGGIHFTKEIFKETEEQLHRRATKLIAKLIIKFEQKDWRITAAKSGNDHFYDLELAKSASIHSQYDVSEIVLPDDWLDYFDDMYELDAQIRIAHDVISSFVDSGCKKRSHICFYGLPGSGKTTLCEKWITLIEEHSPYGAVLRLTASQTTKAGLENLLIDLDPKPTLIVIEEVDKGVEDNLTCLLDLCNAEGRIKKTNARVGNIDLPIQALVMCTVNNIERFRTLLAGALNSRMSHRIYVQRPSEKALYKICEREIKKYGMKMGYARPAVQQLKDECSNDPRRLLAILDARDCLLNNSYKKDYDEMQGKLMLESAQIKRQREMQKEVDESLRLDDDEY